MKILLVSGSLPPMKCGVGDYTASLAAALSRRGDTSVAVLTDTAAKPIPSDFDFEVFPIAGGWRMTDMIRIAKVTRRWRPDLVHVQYPTQGYGSRYLPLLLPAFFRLGNVPVVQTWHEFPSRRNLLNAVWSDGLIAVRPNYQANMPKWCRWLIRKKHFWFIPNASAIPTMRLTDNERVSIRSRFAPSSTHLVVYFGFVYPPKRIELLFQIANPLAHHLIVIGVLDSGDEYHRLILDRINRPPWIGKVTVTGFLPAEEAGRILAAADAVVLPFREGGGIWNTSIHAAVAQGTFVLTTAREQCGYDSSRNVYYARPDDVADMRRALETYISTRRPEMAEDHVSEWETIASAHIGVYNSVL